MDKRSDEIYEFGEFRLETGRQVLTRLGDDVALTPKVYGLLVIFLQNPDRLLEKDELIRALWEDSFVEEANLNVTVSALRRALGERPNDDKYIVTVPRRGYRFVADVVRIDGSGAVQPIPGTASPAPRSRSGLTIWAAVSSLVVVVAMAGYFAWSVYSRDGSEASSLKTLAVLPFRPLAGSAGDPALQMGMSDALITKLGSLKQIHVRPTSAISKYADSDLDPVSIGREQQVEAVLDGRIQRADNRVRITVQLIRISDGSVLWSNSFDDYFTNIFAVQDSISEKVTSSLALTLSGNEKQQLAKRATESTEAYSLYLQARYYHEMISLEGTQKALVYYKAAIEKDPDYALPYASMVGAYAHLVNLKIDPEVNLQNARNAAAKAVELDPNLAEAHDALGTIKHVFDWDWLGAEAEFKKALELNPNSSDVHYSYSILLNTLKRHDEAIREILTAQQLNPTAQFVQNQVTVTFLRAGRFEEAMDQARKAAAMDPNDRTPHFQLVRANIYLARATEAQQELGKFSFSPELHERLQSEIDIITADRARGERYFQQKIKESGESTPHAVLATYYVKINDMDTAISELQRSLDAREGIFVTAATEPDFLPLKNDQRFVSLLRKIGLPS